MKIYGYANSPNDRRVRATALHLGLDFEYEQIDLSKGEQKKPEYLAVNPMGKIPVLVDGDFTLFETIAIMQYLGSKADAPLWPKDDRARADITRWQVWTLVHWGNAIGTITFEKFVKKIMGGGEPDPARIKEGTELFHTYSPVLENQLKGRKWVTGADVTLADFFAGGILTYKDPLELPLGDYPEISRWYEQVEGLDAWKRTVPPMLGGA